VELFWYFWCFEMDIRKDHDKKLALKIKTLERENRQLKIKIKQVRRILGR
jgi:hypothetical protein